jgi:hypothetical protein
VSLVLRGTALADAVYRTADARRYLYRAWVDFARGVDIARETGQVGYLIDAFDDGVRAAALSLGMNSDVGGSARTAKQLWPMIGVKSDPEAERLIARMEELADSQDDACFHRALAKAKHEHDSVIVELRAFLDGVAALVDPSRSTTAFDYVVSNWDTIVENVMAFTAELAEKFGLAPAMRTLDTLGDPLPGGTTVVLRLPDLSPATMPALLDRTITSIHADWTLDIFHGFPLTADQPILEGNSDIGVNIKVFTAWCDGWGQPPDAFAGRLKEVLVKRGDTIAVGAPLLTAEVTSDSHAVQVIRAAASACKLEGMRALSEWVRSRDVVKPN